MFNIHRGNQSDHTHTAHARIVIVLLWRVHMVFRVRAKGVHTLVHA